LLQYLYTNLTLVGKRGARRIGSAGSDWLADGVEDYGVWLQLQPALLASLTEMVVPLRVLSIGVAPCHIQVTFTPTASGARGSGTADSNNCVYGCFGSASTTSAGPDSTT